MHPCRDVEWEASLPRSWLYGFSTVTSSKPKLTFCVDHHQLSIILDILGTPSLDDFYAISSPRSREYIRALPFRKKRPFSQLFPKANPLAIDLMEKCLTFSPKRRIKVEDALKHPYLEVYIFLVANPWGADSWLTSRTAIPWPEWRANGASIGPLFLPLRQRNTSIQGNPQRCVISPHTSDAGQSDIPNSNYRVNLWRSYSSIVLNSMIISPRALGARTTTLFFRVLYMLWVYLWLPVPPLIILCPPFTIVEFFFRRSFGVLGRLCRKNYFRTQGFVSFVKIALVWSPYKWLRQESVFGWTLSQAAFHKV